MTPENIISKIRQLQYNLHCFNITVKTVFVTEEQYSTLMETYYLNYYEGVGFKFALGYEPLLIKLKTEKDFD